MRRLIPFLLAMAFFAIPGDADAQNCKKGKPCGNTCIARDKNCTKGAGTARAAGGSASSSRPEASAPMGIAAPADAAFVALSRGRVYYRAGCSGARKLSPANLLYFASREEAEAAGYTPSRSKGCG